MLTKKNEKYVKELDKIIRKALKQIIKLCKNTYGKGMHRKLWNLGNILIDEIYAKFNIFPIKYKGYITYCYYVED
jgi:hypothetical protein